MDLNIVFSVVAFILATIVAMVQECYTKGVVSLDILTFDKVVSKFSISVIKVDVAYPYGKKEDAYNEFAESLANNENLLVASVGVKDYGEMDNVDLAKRLGVNSTDFPAVIMFTSRKQAVGFDALTDDAFTKENLVSFVRLNNHVYVGAPGCVEQLDELAAEFTATRNEDERKEVLSRAEKFWDDAVGNQAQRSAEIYVKLMRKVLKLGDGFLDSEKTRLSNILTSGTMSDAKKIDVSQRLNIIDSFTIGYADADIKKDEL